MSNPYLIAHKVRGEPAFDVATRMECPECEYTYLENRGCGCPECDQSGWWWIIPTSGHRAYPWWSIALKDLQMGYHDKPTVSPTEVSWDNIDWATYPDHYTHSASPQPALDISALVKRKPITIRRS